MNTISKHTIWPALVLGASLALSSTQSVAETTAEVVEWEKVQNSATPEAYAHFLKRFPGHELAVKARSRLRDHLHGMHSEAYGYLTDDDDAMKEKARELYREILKLDSKDAMATNNIAYILISEFTKEASSESSTNPKEKEGYEKELVQLLKHAQRNANRRRVSKTTTALAAKASVGGNVFLFYSARPVQQVGEDTTSLRNLVKHNLTNVSRDLDIPYEEQPEIDGLNVTGTVVDRAGNVVRDEELSLFEIRILEGDMDSVSEGFKFETVIPVDQDNKVLVQTTHTDEFGEFTFVLTDSGRLDPFSGKLLTIMGRVEGSPVVKHQMMLTKDGAFFAFKADPDARSMYVGEIVLQK